MKLAISDNNEFARLCFRTSPSDLAPIKERIENIAIEYEMILLMERLVSLIAKLDHIKKYVFYGKQNPYIENILANGFRYNKPSNYSHKNIRIAHSVLGIATEGGELVDMLLKHIKHGFPIDEVNFIEELGDVEWYVAEGSTAINVPMSIIAGTVIEKLKTRFPEKYTDANAIIRDLSVERSLLESSLNGNL
jgi:NTP pyrophosphatase (non-canonical NTP hydrolase)